MWHTVSVCFFAIALLVSAQSDQPPLSAEEAATAYPPLNATNLLPTRLFGFQNCKDRKPQQIWEAYDDAGTLANTPGVLSDIDWNSAAAVDYLGPSAFNKPQQKQIQAVFANAATVRPSIINPFTHWIKVRCDDPLNICANNEEKDDKCNPNPEPNPPEGKKRTSKLNAYSLNRDPDQPKFSMINFCNNFFDNKRSLSEVVAIGKSISGQNKFDLNLYLNRGETMLHEMLHLDLVADSKDDFPNPIVDDMTIRWTERDRFDIVRDREGRAYAPLRAKLFARFEPRPGLERPDETGIGVQSNSDNLVLFALAIYVQSKLGMYPHKPIVTALKLIMPRFKTPNKIVQYSSNADTAMIMSDEGDDGLDGEPVPDCNHRMDEPEKGDTSDSDNKVMTLTRPLNDSMYPSEYLVERYSWLIEEFEVPGTGQMLSPRCISGGLREHWKAINYGEASDKIKDFCSNTTWWTTKIVSPILFGDGEGNKAYAIQESFPVSGEEDRLYLDVSPQSACVDKPEGFSLAQGQSD